ncbi:MAG: C39 family peptidase [Kofleriaceae bacterium]|nr:C39 family peptidase [Kofleriaceae bacterium]
MLLAMLMQRSQAGRRLSMPMALLVAALVFSGCIAYSGGARPTSAARLTSEPGWTVAMAPTVRQHNRNDCGVAALAMVVQRWHVALSRDQILAEVAPLTDRGVALGALRAVATRHGLLAFVVAAQRTDLAYEIAAGRPVVVGLLRPHGNKRQSHFEVVVAIHHVRGLITTIDPGAGLQVRNWRDFEAEWQPAGHPALVVLGPVAAPAAATTAAAVE